MHFETYEPFISLIIKFLVGCCKQQITETAHTESEDMGARLYTDKGKVTVNFTLEQATKASGGVQAQLYSFINLSTKWGG
jgi:hypothetical protein